MSNDPAAWDGRYEVKAVTILSAGFGLVAIDRFIIYPLFPLMARDLGLGYADIGLISAVLALTWGIAAIFSGHLSDRFGEKAVLVPSVIIFSVLVLFTGFAESLAGLLVIRGLMGFAEGAFVPASIVAVGRVTRPSRVGLVVGVQQMTSALLGQGLTPVLATQLLKFLPNWHWVFAVVALPGLVQAAVMARVLRPLPRIQAPPEQAGSGPAGRWAAALRLRATWATVIAMVCWLSCMMSLAAMLPSYLTDHLGLTLDRMGFVLSGLGIGGMIGVVAVPALSDRVGRKPVVLVCAVATLLALWAFIRADADPVTLFALMFVVALANGGNIAITIGPMIVHSLPAHLVNAVTGLVVGCGEIIGGAVAPAAAGLLAQTWGIVWVPHFALAAIIGGLFTVLFGVVEPRGRLRPGAAD